MNRFLIPILLSLPVFSFSQTYELCMQVIGSTGGHGIQAGYDFTWTVGEPVVATVNNFTRVLTQGFHQPDVCVPTTHTLDLESIGLEVFPNPTSDALHIRYDASVPSALNFMVDMLGNVVSVPQQLAPSGASELNTSDWAPGVYFLQFFDKQSNRSSTVKVVRI